MNSERKRLEEADSFLAQASRVVEQLADDAKEGKLFISELSYAQLRERIEDVRVIILKLSVN